MTDGDESEALDADTLDERLDTAEAELEAAETEADLDGVEATLDEIEADLDAADLPEPDDEDEEGPRADLEERLSTLRDDLEDARGPYASDVIEQIESAKDDVETTEWTEDGEADLVTAVENFVGRFDDELDTNVRVGGPGLDELAATLDEATAVIEDEDLDPDDDAETIATLLEAAEELAAAVEAAEEWDDLTVREQLQAQGYYDVLDHRKDYPPEWGALKVWEKRARTDMVLLALESFDSDFMEEHCLEALERLGDEESLDVMLQRAERRDADAIRILGKIASEEPVDTLLEYVDADSDPRLQKATFKALGEIGSEEAVQPIANKLVAEDADIRSHAARALGKIGDTRAIEPLSDVLAEDDSDTARASAAWALNQIGTEDALEEVRAYADDRAYLVQDEAEKAV